jgi:hypothetical protein
MAALGKAPIVMENASMSTALIAAVWVADGRIWNVFDLFSAGNASDKSPSISRNGRLWNVPSRYSSPVMA